MPLERHELRHRDGRRLFIYGELRGTLPDEPDAAPDEITGGPAGALHKRYDRLTGSWIAVSPARNVRPHAPRGVAIGAAEADLAAVDADPACPLRPGGPEVPFSYKAAVFENRFPSLVANPPPVPPDPRVSASRGRCEVVLYTERHNGSLATLSPGELSRVVAIWRDRSGELWADPRHRFVLVFENRGDAVGATISHPHGQIYAFDHVPPLIAARSETLSRHRAETGECLTCAVVADDFAAPDRVLAVDEHLVTAVPFAPRWPFELHVRSRRHGARRLGDLDPAELVSLAGALRAVVERYDRLFGFELPYMMVALEAPADAPDWHLAFEFLPPHRSERLLKIRASVETATGLFINDTLPEASAERLRAVAVTPREEVLVPDVVPVAIGSDNGERSG